MANVKVPKLLHKMSLASQKAWYKKQGMEMPSATKPAEGEGKSAAAAKKVKVAPRKAVEIKPGSIRAINQARQDAYKGRQPIGATGSGGHSVMAGSNMSTAKGIIAGIKAGYNPRVSLNPYEGMTKKEKEAMKKEGVQIDKIVKAKTPSMREIDAALDAEKKGNPGPANKLRDIMRAKKAAQAQSSKEWAATRPAQKFPVYEPGRRYVGDSVELDGPVIDEVTKKEAEAVLGGPVKAKPKMPPGKQPAGYRYVRGLARKAMKAGMKKEEVEQVDEAKLPHVATFVPLKRHIENKSLRDAIHIPVNVAHGDKSHKEKLVKKIGAEKAAMYKLHGVFPKRVDEEVEQVDEKINLVKAKMGDVITDFQKSDAPQFRGKSMAKRRQMALAAKLGAEREAGMREEAEGKTPETDTEVSLAKMHGNPKKITYGDVVKARIASAKKKVLNKD